MLIEMVAVTLTVFAGLGSLSGVLQAPEQTVQDSMLAEQFIIVTHAEHNAGVTLQAGTGLQEGLTFEKELSAEILSPVPSEALTSDIPEEAIVKMLAAASLTPTPTTMPTTTPTPTQVTPTQISTPTPTETPTPTPTTVTPVTAPGDLDGLFSRFAEEYSVDQELLKRIAKCESGFNQEAVNRDYVGMFQFAASSWSAVRTRMGADPNPDLRKSAEESIKTAAYHIANGGRSAWPSCK